MRRIKIMQSDFDTVSGKRWTSYAEGILLYARVVMDVDELGIQFLLFNAPIADDQEVVNFDDSIIFELLLSTTTEHIAKVGLEKLAKMTLAEIGEYLTNTKRGGLNDDGTN